MLKINLLPYYQNNKYYQKSNWKIIHIGTQKIFKDSISGKEISYPHHNEIPKQLTDESEKNNKATYFEHFNAQFISSNSYTIEKQPLNTITTLSFYSLHNQTHCYHLREFTNC